MTRVLAVDDEELILVLIQRVAEDLGFTTHVLSDTRRFMTTFVRFKPDIVVIDIVMPHMDGIEIIQWLKDVDYSGALIIMSGFDRYERLAHVLAQANSRMFISRLAKPWRIAEMKESLSAAASRPSA
jgi:DNA-binding response OmpR family regulator